MSIRGFFLLIVTLLPCSISAQRWSPRLFLDIGAGRTTWRTSSGVSLDVSAQLSLTSSNLRPSISAAIGTNSYSCAGSCTSPNPSTWIGFGATYVFNPSSRVQPFVTAELGSFHWRSSDRAFAWLGIVGLAFGDGPFLFRLTGRVRQAPDLGRAQYFASLGVGMRP